MIFRSISSQWFSSPQGPYKKMVVEGKYKQLYTVKVFETKDRKPLTKRDYQNALTNFRNANGASEANVFAKAGAHNGNRKQITSGQNPSLGVGKSIAKFITGDTSKPVLSPDPKNPHRWHESLGTAKTPKVWASQALEQVKKLPTPELPPAYNLQLDTHLEVKRQLGTALTQLSGGKVQSLEQLEAYKGPDRAKLEARLNQEVTKASGGQVKSYKSLMEKAKGNATPGQPGYNPAAAVTYAATGAVVAYNILRSAGLSPKDAAWKLPGSFSRSLITAGIAQVPVKIKDPYLQVAFKGGIGAVLTVSTNMVAGKLHPNAALSPTLNNGMVVAAFTTAGAVVGLKELQKRGYLGGLPPDNPKDWKEWFQKYAPPSAAIGVGLVPPLVIASALNAVKNGRAMTPQQLVVNGGVTLVLPFVQNLLANAIVNPPPNASLDPRKFPPATVDKLKAAANTFSQMGLYVVSDKILNVANTFGKTPPAAGTPAATWSLGASAAGAAWVTEVVEAADVLATGVSLIGRNTKDVNEARKALDEIDKLLKHPFTYLSNPNPALSAYEAIEDREARIAGLKLNRKLILEQHPELLDEYVKQHP